MEKGMDFIKKYSVIVVLLILVVVFGALKPHEFLSSGNMFTILRQVTIMGIMTVGLLFVMLAGGIDLSIGSMVSLTSVLGATLMVKAGLPVVVSDIIVLLIAAVTGLITGFIIVKTDIPPMIGTLALQMTLQGIAYLICGGLPVSGIPQQAKFLAQGYIAFIPFPVILLLLVIIAAAFVLNKTYIGRHFYVVGSNEEAARLSGINTQMIRIGSYVLCSLMSGVAGLIMLGRVSSGQPSVGTGMEMNCLTAAVLGGVSLMGGEGKISKTITGVLIIGVLTNGMTIMNISEYNQMVVQGLIFLAAVCFDGLQRKWSLKKRKKVRA